jgi:hypothetical protein
MTRAAKALELSLMLKNILDQADDDPIPLALAKKKVNSINDLVDLEPADFHTMIYDEEVGFEDDGVTPKYKSEELPVEAGHFSRSSRHMFIMRVRSMV